MLYLAYVTQNPDSGTKELCLLAYQKADQLWQVMESESLPYLEQSLGAEGNLVLVTLGENREILAVENAKSWILEVIQQYLSYPALTPEWIECEKARIEQGRQEITAKSLDLTRRQLELETQREQVQELENQLKKQQEQ